MSVTAPPRPPRSNAPVTQRELEAALVEALVEEARRRAGRRRRRNAFYAVLAGLAASGIYAGVVRLLAHGGPTAVAAAGNTATASRSKVGNGPLTLFLPASNHISPPTSVARIVTVARGKTKTLWHCPGNLWCGQSVSFAWAPDGKRVAFTLDEIGGTSPYVGLHVVNVVTGRDTQIPQGAPRTATIGKPRRAWDAFRRKTMDRVGCWPAAELAWSLDGSSLAYRCGNAGGESGSARGAHINVLKLRGSGYTTVPTGPDAFWPAWSPTATRIAYSTQLTPSRHSQIYTVALDGMNRRLVASGGAAPAWSPDGRTIAYQTRCGIRLATPFGTDITPHANANSCGAIGLSGPPVWSPDGTKLAVETTTGTYVMNKDGAALHLISRQATTTWYGALPGRPSWRPAR